MIIVHGQFEAFRTRGDGSRILSVSTYEQDAEEVSKVINGKIGQEYIIMMIPTGTIEADEFVSETEEQTRDRFWKRMHALITDIAEQKGMKPEEFKEFVKTKLKEEGKIKESTKELSIEGLASIIIRLKKYKDALK